MKLQKQIYLCVFLLIAITLAFEMTSVDLWVQKFLYDASATDKQPLERWMIYKHNPALEFWFHKAIRVTVSVFGGCVLILGLAGFLVKRLAPYRQRLLFLACAVGLVPLLVAGSKNFTNTFCPNQISLYGGDKPYVKLLEHYPADFQNQKKGRCFPAGYATAGFGFMGLYFVLHSRKARRAGLTYGLTFGWSLGVFQMMRGEHFLSHTIFSMVASWLVILLTLAVFRRLGDAQEFEAE